MKILHLFNEYLPLSEHWVHDLLTNAPEHEHYIYAQYYNHVEKYSFGLQLLNKKQGKLAKKYASLSKTKINELLPKISALIQLQIQRYTSLTDCIEIHDIDLIHIHFGTTAAAQWDEIKKLNLPIIVSFYGWDYNKALQHYPSYRLIYQDVFKHVSKIIVEGPHGSKTLQKLGAPVQKISLLPLGITPPRGDTFPRSFKEKDVLRLIQIASFTEKKGQVFSLRAVQKAISEGMKVSLTLIGDDRDINYAKNVKSYIKEHKLEQWVVIEKWLDFTKIKDVFSNYDVFIHPSLHAIDGDCEGGSPVILLLAQACGLPIISTYHCDIPNQTLEGKTALLTNEEDAEGLFLCIKKFNQMRHSEYMEMSKYALEWSKEFDVALIGKRLSAIYQSISILDK